MAKLPKADEIVIQKAQNTANNAITIGQNVAKGYKNNNTEVPNNNPPSGGNPPKSGGVTLNPTGYSGGGGYSVSGYDPATNKAYQDAMAKLNQAYANNPTYTPSYDAEIQRLYSEIVNRGKFNYDLLSDPLYQQYREQYVNQGNMAMMDTMGQAAALTGGYGSSYSQAVGQQQYNNYLNQLNQMVPEFYDRAFNYWQAEGQDLYNQYGLVSDMRDTEYNQYRDAVADYWNQVNYLSGRADTYYNQGADNYWNTQSMNQQNYWNEQNMAFDNYWNQQNMANDNYWRQTELDNSNYWKQQNMDNDNYWNQLNYEAALKKQEEKADASNTYMNDKDYASWKTGLDNVKGNKNKAKTTRSVMIAQAYSNGMIDENRVYALLSEYGISEEEFNSALYN